MQKIAESPRLHAIETRWERPVQKLFYDWHWKENLKHREIAGRIGMPRPTVTRWFDALKIPTQSCTRFTNLNLLNTGPKKTPPAKPKIKKEFPWKFNQEFFKKWSPEMAYVLGFMVADGYVFTNPYGSCYFCFVSTDREIVEKIRKVLGSNHKIGIRSHSNPKWKPLYVLQIGNRRVVKDLTRFGIIQNKSLIIRFPKLVPSRYLRHFVRGYFDGDGCVYFKQHWDKGRKKMKWVFQVHFTSGSKSLLYGLKKALGRYTRGGFIYKKVRGYELTFSNHDGVSLFKAMYGNISNELYLTRKYILFKKALATLYNMGP